MNVVSHRTVFTSECCLPDTDFLINDSDLRFLRLLVLSQDANSVIKGVQLINAAVMHSTGYADAKVIIATR